MSKLSEAIGLLEPLADTGNWYDGRWNGRSDVRAVVRQALDGMREVDLMMNEIARATSLPATAEERAERAVKMAAAEMRNVPPARWPEWMMELLEGARPHVSPDDYRAALQALQGRIAARLNELGL